MEDEFNQKVADLIISMSDIAVYVVDVKQFATIAQLIEVINEANVLIRQAVNLFDKHKERGFFSEYSLINFICRFTYLKTQFREDALCTYGKGARRARNAPDKL